MADYNLGPYRIKPRGAYSGETSYTYLDLVAYNGCAYLCTNEDLIDGTSCIGIAPEGDSSSELYWMCITDPEYGVEEEEESDEEDSAFLKVTDYVWDYAESDKIYIPASTSAATLEVRNMYDGCCGLMVTKHTSLSLPSNSLTSIDFDYVTLQTGQLYLYSFVYGDFGDGYMFMWNRTVMCT